MNRLSAKGTRMPWKKSSWIYAVIIGGMVLGIWGCRGIFPTNPLPSAANWSVVGQKGLTSLSGPANSFLSLFVDNTTPYLALADNGVSITVEKFNGTSWGNVGSPDFGFCYPTDIVPQMFVNNGIPYVEYFSSNGVDLFLADYTSGSGWQGLSQTPVGGFYEGSEPPYTFFNGALLEFSGDAMSSFAGTVTMCQGGSCAVVGNPDFTPPPYFPAISAANGMTCVAYTDASGNITVMSFNGGTWSNLGTPGFATTQDVALYLSTSNGVPFVAFSDPAHGGNATVMKWTGTSWVTVGIPGFTSTSIGFGNSSFFVYNGIPSLAYINSNNQLVVMQFNGSAWFALGGGALTQGGANFPSLFVSNGKTYVAFFDGSANWQATVMKYL